MKKGRISDYGLTVKIIAGYIVVRSADFDFTIAAGPLLEAPTRDGQAAIGRAVLQGFIKIEERISAGCPEESGKLVSIGAAAKLLKLSVSSVRRLVEDGKLKACRTEGRHRRLYLNQVESYRDRL